MYLSVFFSIIAILWGKPNQTKPKTVWVKGACLWAYSSNKDCTFSVKLLVNAMYWALVDRLWARPFMDESKLDVHHLPQLISALFIGPRLESAWNKAPTACTAWTWCLEDGWISMLANSDTAIDQSAWLRRWIRVRPEGWFCLQTSVSVRLCRPMLPWPYNKNYIFLTKVFEIWNCHVLCNNKVQRIWM